MVRYKKSWLLKRQKMRDVDVVSRKGQPQVQARVKRLKNEDIPLTPVASSWIEAIGWMDGEAVMKVKGRPTPYTMQMPFKVFEEWYYALSKGSYFNTHIRGNY